MDEELFLLLVRSSRPSEAFPPWAAALALSVRLAALSQDERAGFCAVHAGMASERLPLGGAWLLESVKDLAPRPCPVDAALWKRRALAEQQLLLGVLPISEHHDDPYVRALALLAHPPSPDPTLFDAPLAVRAAVYLRARAEIPEAHLDALTALLLMDERAPVQGLLPLLQTRFADLLAPLLAPYGPVLEGLDGELRPTEEQLALAEQVVDNFVKKTAGDPFAPVRGLSVPQATAALQDAADRRQIDFGRRPILRLIQQQDPLAAALLDGIFQRSYQFGERQWSDSIGDGPRRSVPFLYLILARAQTDRDWWPLRARFEAKLAVLAGRLDALAGETAMSEQDPLAFPARLMEQWRKITTERPKDEVPSPPVVFRCFLTRPPAPTGDRAVREPSRLIAALVRLGRPARPHRPLDATEQMLLTALREAPGDPALLSVYADWHEQRGNDREVARLLALLHRTTPLPGLPPSQVALVAAHLGDPIGVPLLLEDFARSSAWRIPIASAFWDLRLAEIPPPLLSLEAPDLDTLALMAVIAPDDVQRVEALLDGVPRWVAGVEESGWDWPRLGTVRLALRALARVAPRHIALRSEVSALLNRMAQIRQVQSLLGEHPSEDRPSSLEEEVRWCQEWSVR